MVVMEPLLRSTILQAGTIRRKPVGPWPGGSAGRDLEAYALVLLEAGSGVYLDEAGRSERVSAGDVLVLFPGLRHRYGREEHDPLWSEHFLVCAGPLFEVLEAEGLLSRSQPVWRTGADGASRGAFRDSFAALVVDVQSGKQWLHPHRTTARLHQLIVDAQALHAGRDRVAHAWREAACALLGERLDQDLPPAAAARTLCMHEQAFRKRFRRELGIPPQQYRLQRRLDHAQQLLLEETRSLAAVATACGFCDQYHFSRIFKRHRGQSPGSWRASQGLSPRARTP